MRTDFFDMSPGTILDIIRWLCINLHSKCCCKVRYFALQQCQQCTYVTCTYVTYESVTCTKEELLHVDKTWVTWRCWCNTHTKKTHSSAWHTKNIKDYDIFKSTQWKSDNIYPCFEPPPVAQDLEVSHPSNHLLRNSRAEWWYPNGPDTSSGQTNAWNTTFWKWMRILMVNQDSWLEYPHVQKEIHLQRVYFSIAMLVYQLK